MQYQLAASAIVVISTVLLFSNGPQTWFAYNICKPSQIRLQLSDSYLFDNDKVDNSDIAISFHTMSECSGSTILIEQDGVEQVFNNHEIVHSKYNGEQFCHKKICENVYYDEYVHHFKIKLNEQGKFKYSINGGSFLSESKSFAAKVPQRQPNEKQQKFIYFGDLDNSAISQNTWKLLDSLKKDQTIDAYIFLGDYGYEFFQNNGTQGDLFLETLEPYATSVPWLMTPGNHEENLNYSFYNDKIHHPNYHYSNNHYYSVNIGLVHFISVDLNFYNDGNNTQTKEIQDRMIAWLERDLIEATSNRAQVPWIFASGHVPLYCVVEECNPFPTTYHQFDDLFFKYGVDLFLGAHHHKYQFLKPLYQDKILSYDRPDEHTMINPGGPVYLIQGNGGNKNMMTTSLNQHDEYLLYEDGEPGVGRVTVIDEHQLLLEFIRADTQQVQDYQKIIKDSHQQQI